MQEQVNPAAPAPTPTPTEAATTPRTTSLGSSVAARGAGSVLLAVAALIAVGGVTFAVGRLTAPAAATTRSPGSGAGGAFPGGQGGRQGALGGFLGAGGLTIRGTVTATTSSGITIRLVNGTTITIPTDSATTYHRQASASAGDVSSGSEVLVELAGGGQGAGGQAPGGQGPNASAGPGVTPRLSPARDVTIVAR
jgi:hypothetical protein